MVDSLRAGTLMRERAQKLDALTVVSNVEVTALATAGGRIRTVRTSGGDIDTELVVIACGVWSPKLARMAGAHIPLTPAVHQMISVGPIPELAERPGEISFPIIRDMDTFCYERQHGSDMEVGSYAHRPILMEAEQIPSIEQARLSPTELPFTEEDFDPQLEQALELMPAILGNPEAEIRYAINGLLSLTPDGAPVLGESPEVGGLWSAAAVWVKEGPGVGRLVAEWMTDGNPEYDAHHTDIARFYPHQRTRDARPGAGRRGVQQDLRDHPPLRAVVQQPQRPPGPDARRPARARCGVLRGGRLGAPALVRRQRGAARRLRGRGHAAGGGVGRALVVADHQRRAPRDARARRLRRPVGLRRLRRRGARGGWRRCSSIAVAQLDVAPGRVVYTPILDERGGYRADLTIMRLDDDRFRVVTGGANGNVDRKWFRDHLPADGSAVVVDRTSAFTTIGLWGPRARDILGALTAADVSHEGFRFSTCREIEIDTLAVLASRISYVGELGWELYVPIEQGARLWDLVAEAGRPHGAVPVGIGVYGTTGRLEKGYRAHGAELDTERTIVEAGMMRPKVKDADFIGREAYLKQRDNEPARVLATLTVDDHTSADGTKRYMLGGEPVLSADGEPLVDDHGHRSYVTSAGSAPSLGRHILMAYLPRDAAVVGARLTVEYLGEHYPVTVGSVDATPLFDPDNLRVRS